MAKISVVIPTYNNQRTLQRTIDTLRMQSFENFEVIIVNDGGESPSKFLQVDDARFQIFDMPENGGVSTARNFGFKKSKGEIVYFLDSDDCVASDLLDFASKMMDNLDCDIFSVRHLSIDVDKVSLDMDELKPRNRSSKVRKMDPVTFYRVFSAGAPMFLPSTVFFRRSVLLEVGGEAPWHTGLRNAQDTLLILLAGAQYSVSQSFENCVVYNVRPDSLSRTPISTWTARMKAMDILKERLKMQRSDRRLIKVSNKLRQNAARRVARIHFRNSQISDGVEVLFDDIKKSFNLKSSIEVIRLLAASIFKRE